ncbi:MAG TPA: hypothetical protein VH477_11965 [Bryobacteraceae bacterium]|jgi:hypothetical protein
MGAYLQNYGEGEERRSRIIKIIIFSVIGALILWWILYLVLHNHSEKQAVSRFLDQVNGHQYQQAYADWGCSERTPCPNYDYRRFLDDWGPQKKASSPWKIVSVDGCKAFVTVNVQAGGTELQSLGVERGTKTIMYAPAPECQEPQWRWKQFFRRIFGHGSQAAQRG